MKKFLCLFLAVITVIGMFPVTSLAAETKDETTLVEPIGDLEEPIVDSEEPIVDEPIKTPTDDPVVEPDGEPVVEPTDEPAFVSLSGDIPTPIDDSDATITIKAPKGSTVSFGTGASYSGHRFATATSVTEDESGVTAVFALPLNTEVFYRVQNPDGVTYWNFGNYSETTEITVTSDDLYIGSSDYNSKTVFHNFEKNVFDVADIYLNINKEGYLSLDVGDTESLVGIRNWQAIESFYNAKIAVPDVHWQVIDVNGNPSDVVTIVPDSNKSMNATLTANKAGTAIVLVTYDAMIHMQAQGGSQFSAIWPENTGVFIVSVGEDGSSIKTNMTINEGLNKVTGKYAVDSLDYEHDVLYYTGDDGASYSFTPESGCEVSVLRPTLTTDKMTYKNGFVKTGVSVDSNGKVTVSNLTTGTSIVKITKGNVSTYQLIRAKKAEVVITDSEGNTINDGDSVNAGDTVKITYKGIYNPAEKLSGIYNFTPRLFYVTDTGILYSSENAGMGVYNFGSSEAMRTFEYKVSDFAQSGTITLNGGIGISAYGQPVGGHRQKDKLDNTTPDFNAGHRVANLGRLPTVTLNVIGADGLISCEIKATDGKNEIDNVKYRVTAESGEYCDFIGESFDVKEGKYTVTAEKDGYIILRNYEITVTEDGENKFNITLEKAGANAWDGETATEPKKIDGVWQISTAEELYWYVKECNYGTIESVNAVLTADIELAGQKFTAVSYVTDMLFDGQGHTIKNVYISETANQNGSMAYGTIFNSAKDSIIQNLTVTGLIEITTINTSPSAQVYIGGIVGSVSAYTNNSFDIPKETGIYNCKNYVNVKVDSRRAAAAHIYAAGIAGSATNIKNCFNYGDIYMDVESKKSGTLVYNYSNAAGIVGSANQVEHCANYGNITVMRQGTNVAGIVALLSGTASDTVYTKKLVKDCYNVGKINAAAGAIGGIAGTTKYTTVENCHNYGELVGQAPYTGKAFVIGGISVSGLTTAAPKVITTTYINNYYLDSSVPEGYYGSAKITSTSFIKPGYEVIEDTESGCASKTKTEFANGSVLNLLNGEDGDVYGQKIGTNAYPIFKSSIDAVEEVEKLIDEIGSLFVPNREKIEEARKAYDALADWQKALVSNYDKLVKAEDALKKFDGVIGNIGNNNSGNNDDKKNDGVKDIIPRSDDEFNPNTGAPEITVSSVTAVAALLGAVAVIVG